jgi:lysozyme
MRLKQVSFAALVTVGVSTGFCFGYLPHYRPATLGRYVHGIDVSHHQGNIDWKLVAQDDIKAAYLKATEGNDYIDPRYQQNRVGAQRHGIDIGAYHFFTLCSSGMEQAVQFTAEAQLQTLELPPAVDLELIGSCKRRPPTSDVQREVSVFVREVERISKREVLLYIGKSFNDRYAISAHIQRRRWELSFAHRPNFKWAVWQVHGFAKIDGISGRVDLDLFDLNQLGKSTTNPSERSD